jgi:hypothetical protein
MKGVNTCDCGGHHPDDARYYVTCVNGARVGYLLGPLDDHRAALDAVPLVRDLAVQVDRWADFYAFGTAAVTGSFDRPGVLNDAYARATQPRMSMRDILSSAQGAQR